MTSNIIKFILQSPRQIFLPLNRVSGILCYNNNLFYESKKLYCNNSQKVNNFIDEAELQHNDKLKISIDEKYKIFHDEETEIVFDVSEELERINLEELNKEEEYRNPYEGLNMTRGETGVFEIEDLIQFIKRDNGQNIFVAKVPKEWAYVDYIVIVTARSVRHMTALISFIRKAYKLKRHENDIIPRIEGKHSVEWQALDLGNIALHIFTQDTRERFDLETLWAVGSKYDDLTQRKNVNDIEQSYNAFISEFEPADIEEEIK